MILGAKCISFLIKKKSKERKVHAAPISTISAPLSDKVEIYYFIVKNAASVKDADKVAASVLKRSGRFVSAFG